MKQTILKLTAILPASAILLAASQSMAQSTVSVDPSKTWLGYMNVFDLPANGGSYLWGQAWGAADLRAAFTSTNYLTLLPNVNCYNATDSYWVNPDGSGAKQMDASFYVQNDTLAGQTVIFTGTCLTNTLAEGYSCVAFIKDFKPDYSGNVSSITTLVPGETFTISHDTAVGHHIQYGFETIGPVANPATADSLGKVVVAVNMVDPRLSSIANQVLVEGQNAVFTATAQGTSPFTYQWSKVNSDGSWEDLVNGSRISGVTTSTLTISGVTTADAGKYQLIVLNDNGQALSVGVLAVLPLEQVRTNQLIDPGFENDAFTVSADSGWMNFNGSALATTTDYYYGSEDSVTVMDGAYCFEAYSSGAGSYNGCYQDRPVVPGQIYTADAWFLTPASDPISAGGSAWLEVHFFDSTGGFIGYYKSGVIDSTSPTATWTHLFATNHLATDYTTLIETTPYIVAPANAARLRYQLCYFAQASGSVYMDAATLSLKAPSFTAALSGGSIRISFPTLYGPVYKVLYKNSLSDTTWQTLSTVTGDGTVKTVSDAATSGTRFYIVNTQ
jgi:hypothetical protein